MQKWVCVGGGAIYFLRKQMSMEKMQKYKKGTNVGTDRQ